MTLEEFLSRLEGVQGAPGGHVARCPSHEDRSPSLSVTGAHDRILVYCHAGCDWRDVVEALGITPADLWYDTWTDGAPSQPLDWWHYHDEQGGYLFSVVKFAKREGGKRFSQYHVKDGQAVWNLKDVRKVPYRLPELEDARARAREGYTLTVYIVEGEKDVESLRAIGKTATTFPGGAGKMLPTYVKFFRDLEVVIVRDKDGPGIESAELIRDSLEGVARKVWVVEAREGKDVSDHLAAGHAVEELVIV